MRDEISPLDPFEPHDAERSAQQITGVLSLLDKPLQRVLDLGCGNGRVLVPLVEAGHHVIGFDRCHSALERCREHLTTTACCDLIHGDFVLDWPDEFESAFDVICLLGNTLMQIADIEIAIKLLRNVGASLRNGGLFVMDDIAHDLWPSVSAGDWTNGISEDGEWQMVWDEADTVFALREGDAVDDTNWQIQPGETCYRLWTVGQLAAVAAAAGLSPPQHHKQFGLYTLSRRGRS